MIFYRNKCLHLTFSLFFLLLSSNVWAGSNISAICMIDMDMSTFSYDGITLNDVETGISAGNGNIVRIGILAHNVVNLYGYEIRLKYNSEKLQFIRGIEGDPSKGLNNILKKEDGAEISWMPPTVIIPGTVSISNSLKGTPSESIAPEGSGILAIIEFKLLSNRPDNGIMISNAQFVDVQGAGDNQQADNITHLFHGMINPIGDVDGNGMLQLTDAINILKILSNIYEGNVKLASGDIVNNDKIDLKDAISLIKHISMY